jgi:Porin PorA
MRRKIGVALCILGVLLAVFGIIWMTVIWPSLTKVPSDLEQQVDLQGTVSLYDDGLGANVSYDVIGHRKYTAFKASEDIVYLDEDVWFDLAGTDPPQELEQLREEFFLGIDRVTRQNLEGRGDGIGGGYYSFPFNVSKDKVYRFWNEKNPENLDCRYDGETKFEGLHVYIFKMSTPEEGLTTPASFDIPEMRIDQEITLYVEPVSGVTVLSESITKRSGTIPVPDELYPATGPVTNKAVTFYEDNLTFTQDTIDDLVGQAKSAKSQVALAKDLLPWLSIGGGIVLIAVGVFLALKASKSAAWAEEKASSGSQPP